ncbi:MAG: ribonuclease Z [Sphingobacteriaceae bacterium]
MRFDVTILGSSSATPIYNRNPTAQALNCNEHLYLIDCAEGTQQQMLRFEVKSSKIDCIFISHLHGDHYLGLVGLLSSMHLNGRKKSLRLFGPPELIEIINLQLRCSQTSFQYELLFRPTQVENAEVIFENQDLIVETIILQHRIACTGFLFRQKQRQRKIVKEIAAQLDIPLAYFKHIKEGADYFDSAGNRFLNSEITTPASPAKTYAYCSDTLANGTYFSQIKNADLLYHEATFAHDMLDRALETHHTTAKQAAEIALQVGAKKLLIGHFSARYKTLEPLLEEARAVFPNTDLAIEGRTFTI